MSERIINGNDKEEKNIPIPVIDAALKTRLSARRITELLKEGRGGNGKWYTTVEAVEEYSENLPTPEEFGRKGGLIAGRGRPKAS